MSIASLKTEKRSSLPDIDCVIIGVNCTKTLGRCIDSIIAADYPGENLHIYYVDGGSNDESIKTAEAYAAVTVIALNPDYPTPGLGRNQGWKKSRSPFIQFLDSDTIVNPRWFLQAVAGMAADKVGAVTGFRREMFPERSIYNWIGDIEWNGPVGKSDSFGGDVLIRRRAIEKIGGYDEILVGGEDPELSRRLIRAGWEIIRIDAVMTAHDLAMKTIRQYLRRAFRSGYGFAAVRDREAKAGSSFWKYDFQKIIIKGGGFLCAYTISALLISLADGPGARLAALLLLAIGTASLLSPRLFKVKKFMRENGLNRSESKTYAWHCSLVVVPQLFGVIRYYAGQCVNAPMRNRRNSLKTGLSTTAI